ncbi:MAG: siroheme synthase [Rhodospirillales bacterium]|nr:siroheme synthase [Rhodospirillales bacterium]
MIPVTLDPIRLRLGVAGDGPAVARRLRLLAAAGASPLHLCGDPAAWPPLDLLWIADMAEPAAARLAAAAHDRGILVNVEDRPELCDFRNTAELRRGDLLVAVSTGGQSPGLAGAIRDRIGALFGPDWADRVAALGARRRAWRAEGRSLPELARLTAASLSDSGWLA